MTGARPTSPITLLSAPRGGAGGGVLAGWLGGGAG